MDEPIMPEPITQPPPPPFVRQIIDHKPDGTVVEVEVHHNAEEL
jgi:hypothetical protein